MKEDCENQFRSPPRRHWPWALVWLAAVAWLVSATWLRWGNLVIDTGVDMYTPWALMSGKVLYRDLFYPFGPFTPYFHALLYVLFKPHLYLLFASGLVTGVLTGWLIQRLAARHLSPRLGAFVALVFVLANAFGYYAINNIFNYLAPYSYTAIHSMLFCLAALWFHGRHLETRRARHRNLALGFLFLALVTRYEIGGILAVALGFGVLLDKPPGGTGRWLLRETALLSLPLIAAAAVYLLFFTASRESGFWEAFLGLFSAHDFAEHPGGFYAWALGVDRPGENLRGIALSAVATLGSGMFLGAAVACLARLKRRPHSATALGWIGLAVGFGWCGIRANQIVATDLAIKYLPLLAAGLVCFYAWRARRSSGMRRRDAVMLATLALFSFLALLRILLRTDFNFYGFYLSVPGLILSQVFFLREIPAILPWTTFRRFIRIGFVLHGLLVALTLQGYAQDARRNLLTLEVRSERGNMRVIDAPPMRCLGHLIDLLSNRPGPKPELVVFPEGVGVNFLTGLENPLYLNIYLPFDLAPAGTIDSIIRQMELKKPEYVIEVERTVVEFGSKGFAADYGLPIRNYLERTYSLVYFEPQACVLLRRKDNVEHGGREP
ncbi:MAG: hypothetical protein ACYC9Y_02710 [Candidatus Methylomirabilia bacterium]